MAFTLFVPFRTRFCPCTFTILAFYLLDMYFSYFKSMLNLQELLYELLHSHTFVPLLSLLNLNVVKRLPNTLT